MINLRNPGDIYPPNGIEAYIYIYLYRDTLYIFRHSDEPEKGGEDEGYVIQSAQDTDKLTDVLRAMIRRQKYNGIKSEDFDDIAKLAGVSDFDFRTEAKLVKVDILKEDDIYVLVGPYDNIYQIGQQKTKVDDEKLGEKVLSVFKFTYALRSA